MLIYLQLLETEEQKNKFEQIYSYYQGLMYHVAYEILQNKHDTEDAVHQAFLYFVENIDSIQGIQDSKTKSYIVVVTEHKAIDVIRAKQRIVDLDFEETIRGISIPMPGDHGLADAMAKLPARYREVLLLRFDNGYTTKELARYYETSQENVQKLIWRAREALWKIYAEDLND